MTFSRSLSIGALAQRTGVSAPTIRYYEEIGLLKHPSRGRSGRRIYSDSDVRRLTLIRRCREFGLGIKQVHMLVALVEDSDRSCLEVRDLAHAHLAAVRAKLAELQALEATVTDFANKCDTECAGVPGSQCVVLTDLSREYRAHP